MDMSMKKQKLVSELNYYLMIKMCQVAAEGLGNIELKLKKVIEQLYFTD